ncbi:MAG: universal stress protein [Polymorphobacter sp.]|uniref:universal stress protein n=1 Tax=Polymorphobacter sp. TaxID=1909290 RepID=UPI003A883594
MSEAPTYLVVIDRSEESAVALRFAALRAGHVGARVLLLHVIRPPEFMPLGAVQDAIRAEAEEDGEALLASSADAAEALSGHRPETRLLCGEPGPAISEFIRAAPDVRALVLATAAKGNPGPLVNYFSGERVVQLPCVTILVPGGLQPERIQAIS